MSCRVSSVPSSHRAFLFLTVQLLVCGLVAAQTEPTDSAPEALPDSPPQRADLSAANEFVKQQRYDEAEAKLAALQEQFPEDPDLLFMRGEILLALQRPVDAMPLLRTVAELDPERPRVHFQLATALSATGDADAALEEFAAEIAHNEDPEVRTLALLNRSMLFQQQRDWSGAASELEQFLELDPSRSEAFGDLASLYIQAGDLAAAAEALERGVAAGFESAQHFYSLGARWYKAERYENSVTALTRALEIDPQLARAERSMAAALERLNRNEEAVQHLQRYLELAPDAPDADKVAERIKAAQTK
jgi:tetratricopeptide (TPR) repeat protein